MYNLIKKRKTMDDFIEDLDFDVNEITETG